MSLKKFSQTKRLLIYLFIFVVLTPYLFPLDPDKKVTQYIHNAWGILQGLPQNTVRPIIQTMEGYLWMGTQEGLVRFDGARFKVYDKRNVEQIADNWICALCEDREGNLWIGTNGGGLTCMSHGDSREEKFTRYTEKQGLSGTVVWSIYEDHEGWLWIGTDKGLNRMKDGKFTVYTTRQGLSNDRIRCIYKDKKGCLWIGTYGGGLNRFEDGKFTAYTTKEGFSNDYVLSIYEDKEGSLWFGTYGGGLNRFKNGKFTAYTKKEGLPNDHVESICEDRDGSLWFGTDGSGLNRLKRLDSKDGKFTFKVTSFTTGQGLSDDTVIAIYEDREGSLWIGTENGGLNRLKDGKFTTYTTKQGLSNDNVMCVYEDRAGSLWFGTHGGGLNRFNVKDGKFTTYTTKEGLSNDYVYSIYEDREGSLWIGTNGYGLNRFKDGKFTTYTTKEGLSDDFVWTICEDREGSLWIGTSGGVNRLNRVDPRNGKSTFNITTYTTKQGLSSNIICFIYEDREGKLWIGTEGGGLNRMDREKSMDGKFTFNITAYSTKQGLSNDVVCSIYEDSKGFLWIGTYGGLNRMKEGKIKSVTINEGLFDDGVFRILEDKRENLWISCNKGIFQVAKKELNDFFEGKRSIVHCVSYNEQDGMKSRECNGGYQPAGWKSRDGKLWFPTIKGVVVIDPDTIEINQLQPPVVIEEITVSDKKIEPPFSQNNEKMVLSPGTARFEIRYTGLSFLAPGKVLFTYKLEGFDREWLNVGTRRTAYYTKLPPGNYTFRVTACNNDGIWNKTGASISFYQEPYLYQTWWFYMICIIGALFFAVGIYRLRVKQLTRRKIELDHLVAERTHQLEESNKELEKLSIVASETDNAVVIMDAKGNFEWANEGFNRLYGTTLGQVIKEKGGNIVRVSSNPDIEDILDKFPVKRKTVYYESFYTTGSGKKIWAQTTLTPIFDQKGNLTKVVAIDSDISKIKETETQIKKQNEEILKQSQKLQRAIEIARKEREAANTANQAKSEFLARMSHEIRTPMNGIIGFIEMLMDTDLNEEQLDYVRTLSRSSEALTILLNDILDFSRIEAGELSMNPVHFDIKLTLFYVFETILHRLGKKPVEMMCRIDDNVPPYVKGDVGRFRQVLVNLMENAVKFTNEGEIEISLDMEEEEKERNKFHVKVRDTGIGIPEDKRVEIFNVFHQEDGSTTREYGGAGLGLTICKQIAKLMGGDVWVESTPSKGSTFHFTAWMDKSGESGKKIIQVNKDRAKEKEDIKNKRGYEYERKKESVVTRDTMADEAGHSIHILLAEDNPINRKLVHFMLIKAGYRVTMVNNGEEAVEAFTSEPGRFDLIFMDIQMPKMNGIEATREIRRQEAVGSWQTEEYVKKDSKRTTRDENRESRDENPAARRIPIIAMTAQSMEGDREKCLEAGMDDYIAKPIKKKIVFQMVKKWCPESPGGHPF